MNDRRIRTEWVDWTPDVLLLVAVASLLALALLQKG